MKRTTTAAAFAAAAALALAACAPTSAPQSDTAVPGEGDTITLIVPYSAGGTTDVAARAFAELLDDQLGATVVIENTPGAGGQLGITDLAQAAPDGLTIGFTNLPSTIPTYLVEDRGASYDRDSFVPLGSVTRSLNYVAVSASGPYSTLEEMLDAAAADPGGVTVGIAGDDERLGIEAAAASAGVELNIVPFDGGPEKTTALLGGQVDAIVGGGTTIVPGVMNGDFVAIGTFGSEPDLFLPDVPTFDSLGIDIAINGYLTISAPAGTPDEVVTAYEDAIEVIVADPAFVETVEASFQQASFLDSAAAAEAWREQEDLFASLLGP